MQIVTEADTHKAYSDFGIDRSSGLGADYLAWARNRKQSITQEMQLGHVHGHIYAGDKERKPVCTSYTEQYEAKQEAAGWYRTVKAAKLCGCNPIWLSYACHCGLLPTTTRPTVPADFFQDRYRVRLEDVRSWMATK